MNELRSNLWGGDITHFDTDTRVLEGSVHRNPGSPETKPLHLSLRNRMKCIYTLMIYFGFVSMLAVPSLAQASFVVTSGSGSLPIVEDFDIPQAIFDPLVITSAQIGESFTGQSVSITPGSPPSDNGWEQVTGVPGGPLSLQDAGQSEGVVTWAGNHLQGLLSDSLLLNPDIGEGAISILFNTDQTEFGLDFTLTNSGNITLQFFTSTGTALETFTEKYSGAYTFTSTTKFAGVTITNTDAHGIGIDNLRFAVPEPSLGLLLGISLIGLVGAGAVRKIRQRAVVKVKS